MVIMTLTDLDNHEIKKSKFCKIMFIYFIRWRTTMLPKELLKLRYYSSNGDYQKELEIAEKIFNFKKKIFNTATYTLGITKEKA